MLNDPLLNSGGGPYDISFGLTGWRKYGFWMAVWTFLGALQAFRLYAAYNSDGEQLISMAQAFTWALADWYLWGLLSPAVFAVTRRTAFGSHWKRDLVVHLMAAPVFAAFQLFLYALVYRPLGSLFWHEVGTSIHWTLWSLYSDLAHNKFHAGIITYFLIAFLYFTLYYHARMRRAEEHRAQLSARLTQAQLDALKMQLHPHFLFNTLNAITSLIHSDPDAADRMTTRLGELLRTTLELEGVQEVPLARELGFLSGYLEIQGQRFSDRLKVEVIVPDELKDAMVPALLLQPLVENAVEHGVALLSRPTAIRIQAQKQGDALHLLVANSVPERPGRRAEQMGRGRGLANTRARLLELYGEKQSMEIREGAEYLVIVRIPYRLQPESR